jgi:hypothetical protein
MLGAGGRIRKRIIGQSVIPIGSVVDRSRGDFARKAKDVDEQTVKEMKRDAQLVRAIKNFSQPEALVKDERKCQMILDSMGYRDKYSTHEIAALAKVLETQETDKDNTSRRSYYKL